ncbi:MAG: small, acid-soluble spore protein, H family [Clostridia bacterium]|nr:small, acid-soluble spore protein, H family [Clostridia bacterium]
MNIERVNQIIRNKEILDIYYDDRPVWIQELNNNIARVGFLDGENEKDVFVEELYENE